MEPQETISQIFRDFAIQQRNGAIAEVAAFFGGLLVGIAVRRLWQENRAITLVFAGLGLALCAGSFPYRWFQSGPLILSLLPWGAAVLFGAISPDRWMKVRYGVR
jgi:sugar phosphate permease